MPIYAYKCTGCEDEFDELQSFTDPPPPECTKCGGQVERMLTASSFQLKGGGWYSDGYSSEKGGVGVAKESRKKLTGGED